MITKDAWKKIMAEAIAPNTKEDKKHPITTQEALNLYESIHKPLEGLTFHVPDLMTPLVFQRANNQAEVEMKQKDFCWETEFTYRR